MTDKRKSYLYIFLMTVSFYMMINTKYMPALGDYVLNFIGINAWTKGDNGVHITIIFFGGLYFAFLYLVYKYALESFKYKGRTVFIIFVVLMGSFTLLTGLTTQIIKRNSEGLSAIAYESEGNALRYTSQNSEVTYFEVVVTLKNYSNEDKTFNMSFDSSYFRDENIGKIEIFAKDETLAQFTIKAGAKEEFIITSEEYLIKGGWKGENYSYDGIIDEVVLSDRDLDSIRLVSNNIFGIHISK